MRRDFELCSVLFSLDAKGKEKKELAVRKKPWPSVPVSTFVFFPPFYSFFILLFGVMSSFSSYLGNRLPVIYFWRGGILDRLIDACSRSRSEWCGEDRILKAAHTGAQAGVWGSRFACSTVWTTQRGYSCLPSEMIIDLLRFEREGQRERERRGGRRKGRKRNTIIYLLYLCYLYNLFITVFPFY